MGRRCRDILRSLTIQAANRKYTVDRKPGVSGLPDYYVLTEHNLAKKMRSRVIIMAADMPKVVSALQEIQRAT